MPLTTADKLEIMELAARYNYAIDRCGPEEWAGVFTDDGQVWADGKLLAAGRVQLEGYMRAGLKEGKNLLRHFNSNAVIEQAGGGDARLRIYVMTWDLAGDSMTPVFLGQYDDVLTRVDGQWKFKIRRVTAEFKGGRNVRPTGT